MKKHLFYFIALLLLAVGCAKEKPPAPEQIGEDTPVVFTADELKLLSALNKSVKYEEEDILRIIDGVNGILNSDSHTRSVNGRTVAGIRPVSVNIPANSKTRTETDNEAEETTEDVFYIVDFENDEGYALISADRRIRDEVIVAVGHGGFPTEVENPGFGIIMSGAEDYARNSIIKYEQWRDSVETVLLARLLVEYPELAEELESLLKMNENQETTTRALVSGDPIDKPMPLVWETYGPWTNVANSCIAPMTPVEWGQGAPFNETVVANTPWADTPAGCVPIALVQLMAYWQWPVNYNGFIDWNELCKYTGNYLYDRYKTWTSRMSEAPNDVSKRCADLIYKTGSDIGTDYGATSSSAKDKRALSHLGNLGFTVPYSMSDYSFDPVINSLRAYRPVYAGGYSSKITFLGITVGYSGGLHG